MFKDITSLFHAESSTFFVSVTKLKIIVNTDHMEINY